MSDLFTYEADELLTESIMSSTPIIIVEGNDDVSIYENIVKSISKDIEVYASENLKISNNTSGCNGVKNCLKEIEKVAFDIDFENNILGIIDKDVSDYRNDDINIKGLFVLKYYSIESHFINKENIKYLINNITNCSSKLLDNTELEEDLFNNIKTSCSDLYFISLEALKNECELEYMSDYKYSNSIQQIMNDDYKTKLEDKIDNLNTFAKSKNITNNFDNLLSIVKGKWLLDFVVKELKKLIKELKNICNEEKYCQFCKNDKFEQCSFKLLFTYENNTIKSLLMKNIHNNELTYIKQKINSFAA